MNQNITGLSTVLFAIFVLMIFVSVETFAQPDTVYISSGEVLYGEIKSFDKNVLTFDTKYADSEFKIDWDEVIGLSSSTVLTVYTTDGTRITGTFRYHADKKRTSGIISDNIETYVLLDDIIWFVSHEKDFLERLKISIDGGFSYAKSSETQQFSATANVSYIEKKWYFGTDFNMISTLIKNTDSATRTNGNGNFIYSLSKQTFVLVGLEFLENSSQNLKLRTITRGGTGYYFKRTNSLFFYAGIGIANNHESFGGDSPVDGNSFEGMGIMEFDAFNIGDFSFRTKWIVYPSFSNKGRVRLDGDVSLKYDLPLDFYIKLKLTHNFDSKPLIDISENDFIIQTNIGWEWN